MNSILFFHLSFKILSRSSNWIPLSLISVELPHFCSASCIFMYHWHNFLTLIWHCSKLQLNPFCFIVWLKILNISMFLCTFSVEFGPYFQKAFLFLVAPHSSPPLILLTKNFSFSHQNRKWHDCILPVIMCFWGLHQWWSTPDFTCKHSKTTSIKWTGFPLFGLHQRYLTAFKPTQLNCTVWVNVPGFRSTCLNKTGENTS